MNKLLFILLFLSLKLSAQNLSKEEFRKKVTGSFDSSVKVDFSDSVYFHIDSAYRLPAPDYKARVMTGTNSDSLFIYYYPDIFKDSVLQRIVHTTLTSDSLRYAWEGPFFDASMHGSLVYFYPKQFDTLEIKRLNKTITTSFGYDLGKLEFGNVTLEEVRQEEAKEEPPPPPPPKRKRKRN